MKIKTFLAATAILSVGLLPVVGLAQNGDSSGWTGETETVPSKPLDEALDTIANWLFTILLAVAVIFIILAAYDFVTSAGNPEKVETAKSKVIYALIGLVVAILAKGIVNLIKTLFTK